MSVPASQNTAPVLEFRCLYTREIRRKAKRWQDGHLRFHTFNKRIMIYDDGHNYVGDTHWNPSAGSEQVQDGDEFALERSGVLVQVTEYKCTLQTDLTGLRAVKKTQEPTRHTAKPLQPIAPVPQLRPQTRPSQHGPPTVTRPIAERFVLTSRATKSNHQPAPSIASQRVDNDARRLRDDENHIPLWEILKTSRPSEPKTSITSRPPQTPATADPVARRGRRKSLDKQTVAIKRARVDSRDAIDLTKEDTNRPTSQPLTCTESRGVDTSTAAAASSFRRPIDVQAEDSLQPQNPQDDVREQLTRAKEGPRSPTKRKALGPDQDKSAATPVKKIRLARPASKTPVRQKLPPSSPPVSTTNHLPSPSSASKSAPIVVENLATVSLEAPSLRKPLRIRRREARPLLMCQDQTVPRPTKGAQALSSEIVANDGPPPMVSGAVVDLSRSLPEQNLDVASQTGGSVHQCDEQTTARHSPEDADDSVIQASSPSILDKDCQQAAEKDLWTANETHISDMKSANTCVTPPPKEDSVPIEDDAFVSSKDSNIDQDELMATTDEPYQGNQSSQAARSTTNGSYVTEGPSLATSTTKAAAPDQLPPLPDVEPETATKEGEETLDLTPPTELRADQVPAGASPPTELSTDPIPAGAPTPPESCAEQPTAPAGVALAPAPTEAPRVLRSNQKPFKHPRLQLHPQPASLREPAHVPADTCQGEPITTADGDLGVQRDEEGGPWTREAWDLFGRGPPAKRGEPWLVA